MAIEQGFARDAPRRDRLLEQFAHLARGALGRLADFIVRRGHARFAQRAGDRLGPLCQGHGRLRGTRQFDIRRQHAVADLLDGVGDQLRRVDVFARGAGDLPDRVLGLARRFLDMAERGMHAFHIARRFRHALRQRTHATRSFFRLFIDFAHHHADFIGGFLGALRQLPHFPRHHGKTTPVFAGTRRLDGGVQRQQVGARGNIGNGFRKARDAFGFVLQAQHGAGGALRFLAGLVDAAQPLIDFGTRRHAFHAHAGGHLGGPFRVGGDLFRHHGILCGTVGDVAGRAHIEFHLLFDGIDKIRGFRRADHDGVDGVAHRVGELVQARLAARTSGERQQRRADGGSHAGDQIRMVAARQQQQIGQATGDGHGQDRECKETHQLMLQLLHLSPAARTRHVPRKGRAVTVCGWARLPTLHPEHHVCAAFQAATG